MIVWPHFYLAPPDQVKKRYPWWELLPEWLKTIVHVVVLYLVCTNVWVEPYQIPSSSMEPTFHGDPHILRGDRVIALKWLSWFWPIQRGDVVVFISVEDHHTFIVKRVVGLPGDVIEVKAPHVLVNGRVLENPPSFLERRYVNYGKFGVEFPYTVPANCYFAMGDNSYNSNDGRFWGHLPASHILGKVVLIFWPISRARIL